LLPKDGGRFIPLKKRRDVFVALLSKFAEKRKYEKGGRPMLTIDTLLAVLSFGLACFAVGYTLGKDSNKTQK